MDEQRAEKMTVAAHTLAGVAAGYLSLLFPKIIALPAGIVLLMAVGFASQKMARNKGLKWWAGNGIWIYLLVWLVAWMAFLNW